MFQILQTTFFFAKNLERLIPLELNDDFKTILDRIERTNDNLFITGRAGTGKSTLLQLFRNTTNKKVVVLAPTGIAAINVKGQTIHSFFGFAPRLMQAHEVTVRRNRSVFRNLQAVIIDEISMVRADIMDHIDRSLRINREINAPFGGVQMIFFGDLFQLPPVVSTNVERHFFSTTYETPYFFSSQIFQSAWSYSMVELHKVYRQDERHFIRLLDAIRTKTFDYDDLEDINERHDPDIKKEGPFITLTTVNATANEINAERMKALPGDHEEYRAQVTGDFNDRLFPTAPFLTLKLGAQVMLLKNDQNRKYVNGSIGIVTRMDPDKLFVRLEDDVDNPEEIELDKFEWEILRYELGGESGDKINSKVVGTFLQYPVKLAWAITIHKSQGKTFQRVEIDLGRGAFEYGQTYVALSRCRTLGGIVLKKPITPKDIKVDLRVVDYYETMRRYN